MKPHVKCKLAGLSGLRELVEISGVSERTLISYNKNKEHLFNCILEGCVSYKKKDENSLMNELKNSLEMLNEKLKDFKTSNGGEKDE